MVIFRKFSQKFYRFKGLTVNTTLTLFRVVIQLNYCIMVRNYVRKTERSKWLESNLNKPMEEVKKKNLSIVKAGAFYNVPKSTLDEHVNAKVSNPGTTS